MDIDGTIPIILAGLLGAALHEGLKALASYQETKSAPTRPAVLGSLVFVALGALVPLVYGTDSRNFLEIAQLGVGIPALVSGGFRLATAGSNSAVTTSEDPSTAQYLGWRFTG